MTRLHPVRGLAIILALVLATAAEAQYPPPAPGAPPPGAAASVYAAPQLDQMLAAIALYLDPLLTSILTAATYPLEVDAAARWVQYPPNAGLRGPALYDALQSQPWDPSVKSLVPFPPVLAMMDAHLDWTQALGNAFLAQQSDVMDSIQRLRHEAMAAGTLVSTPQATVTVDGPYILIAPASPELVYIPFYNPGTIYGAWPYPAYPPIYYGPPPGLNIGVAAAGIGFGIGIGVVDALWNWGDWDWRDHQVRVDPARFNRINAGQPPVTSAQWRHDPAHRAGVPYRGAASRAHYEKPMPGSPDARRQYRGYAPAQQSAVVPPAARPTVPEPQRPAQQAVTPPQAPRPPVPPQAPRAPAAQPHLPPAPTPVQPPRPVTAFQSFAPGPAAAARAQRGQESRQSPPPAAQAPRPPPPRQAPPPRPASPAPRPEEHRP